MYLALRSSNVGSRDKSLIETLLDIEVIQKHFRIIYLITYNGWNQWKIYVYGYIFHGDRGVRTLYWICSNSHVCNENLSTSLFANSVLYYCNFFIRSLKKIKKKDRNVWSIIASHFHIQELMQYIITASRLPCLALICPYYLMFMFSIIEPYIF